MVRGGALCLDQSERRDLKVVHWVLEKELEYFSSLWHRMIGLQNKLRLNTERTTVKYQEIWQLWKLLNFNWLLHDNLWLLSGFLIAVVDKGKKQKWQRQQKMEKKTKKQKQSVSMSHTWPANVWFSEISFPNESLTKLKFIYETDPQVWQWSSHYHWELSCFFDHFKCSLIYDTQFVPALKKLILLPPQTAHDDCKILKNKI